MLLWTKRRFSNHSINFIQFIPFQDRTVLPNIIFDRSFIHPFRIQVCHKHLQLTYKNTREISHIQSDRSENKKNIQWKSCVRFEFFFLLLLRVDIRSILKGLYLLCRIYFTKYCEIIYLLCRLSHR